MKSILSVLSIAALCFSITFITAQNPFTGNIFVDKSPDHGVYVFNPELSGMVVLNPKGPGVQVLGSVKQGAILNTSSASTQPALEVQQSNPGTGMSVYDLSLIHI